MATREKAFPLFKGHLVSVHLSGPVRSTTRLDDEMWEGGRSGAT